MTRTYQTLEHELGRALAGDWPGAAANPLAMAVWDLVVAAGNVPHAGGERDRVARTAALEDARQAAQRAGRRCLVRHRREP